MCLLAAFLIDALLTRLVSLDQWSQTAYLEGPATYRCVSCSYALELHAETSSLACSQALQSLVNELILVPGVQKKRDTGP